MAILAQKPVATIWAKDTDGNFYSVPGVNPAPGTDANAVAQLNKLFAAVGKTIVVDKMQLIITKEAD